MEAKLLCCKVHFIIRCCVMLMRSPSHSLKVFVHNFFIDVSIGSSRVACRSYGGHILFCMWGEHIIISISLQILPSCELYE